MAGDLGHLTVLPSPTDRHKSDVSNNVTLPSLQDTVTDTCIGSNVSSNVTPLVTITHTSIQPCHTHHITCQQAERITPKHHQ